MQCLVDEFEKSLPPMDHPLRKLGVRLTELLDDDHWAECERLLLEGWEHDAADRATGARWRANSSLDEWFPYTHEELSDLRLRIKWALSILQTGDLPEGAGK